MFIVRKLKGDSTLIRRQHSDGSYSSHMLQTLLTRFHMVFCTGGICTEKAWHEVAAEFKSTD